MVLLAPLFGAALSLLKPDYSKDKFPPYPPVTDADGKEIAIENWRGTRLYGWKGCEADETKAIAAAFDDLNKLSKPLADNIDWASEVSEDFWGKNEGTHRVPDDRRTQIQQIFKAQDQMWARGWAFYPPNNWQSLWIEVRCSGGDETGDRDNMCRDKKPDDGKCGRGGTPTGDDDDNTLEAYSESTTQNTALWYSRITFCNRFFNLPSLSEAMTNTPKKPAATRAKLEAWNNRARVFQHETTHLDYFMNSPGKSPFVDDLQFDWTENKQTVRDWAYGPKFCKILRNYGQKDQVAFYPQRNADSYAWFALGSYIQKQTGTYPRLPRPRNVPVSDPFNSGGGDVKAADADPALFAAQPPEDRVSDSTEDAYEYAEGFSTPHCPDGDVKTDAASAGTQGDPPKGDPPKDDPPKADNNACHGISGDYWVMSRDVAVENVKDFCGQTEPTKKYNEGSVNELELSVKKLPDSNQSPKDSPDCEGRFTRAVIDGCDGGDPVNNPYNFKFGSTLTTGDGYAYTMKPLSQQVNDVRCDVSYKFLWNEVEIRGKNFPSAKLGAKGEGLQKELDGCGLLKSFSFELTPNDCCFQWYAKGTLEIGTKSCVGSAIKSAGGASDGGCSGAGKRSVHGAGRVQQRDNIDSWPGYGDDSRHVFGAGKRSVHGAGRLQERDNIDSWPGYGDDSRHVFGQTG